MKTRKKVPAATWLLVPAAVTLGIVGCGSLTAGGLIAEASVYVSGDLPEASAGPQPATVGEQGPAPASSGPWLSFHEGVEGEVEVEFLVYLISEGGGTLPLGRDEIRVRVDLRGENEMEVVDELIPATLYTELLLVFTDIDVEAQGLVIDGMPVTEIRVELEDLSLPVTRPLNLDVQPGSRVQLVVDLNTVSWLEAVDPLTGLVDESVFADLVNVVVR